MLKKMPAAMKAAFPHTIPVLTGFLFLGIAYGILMDSNGLGLAWIILTSTVVFAGALQFVGISFLTSVFDPVYAFLIALAVNARHIFYGIAMLGRFGGLGKIKPYMIFAMCDETFSILVSAKPPSEADERAFMLSVALLNQSYWIIGGILGGVIGPLLTFNTAGIDFVMTAFFVVIFINQWKQSKSHIPALVGLGAGIVSLIIFGPAGFIIPAMVLIVLLFTVFRKKLEGEVK